MSSLNEYVFMKDGCKHQGNAGLRMTAMHLEASYNNKKCNSDTNRKEVNRVQRCLQYNIKNYQIDEIERLEKLCIDNNVSFKKLRPDSKISADHYIKTLTYTLFTAGINYSNPDKVLCKECKHFRVKLGNNGICQLTRLHRCSLYGNGCKYGEKKECTTIT